MTIQPPRQHSATPVRIASGTARSALAQLSALCRRRDTSGTLPSAWMLSREPRRGMPSLPESESCNQKLCFEQAQHFTTSARDGKNVALSAFLACEPRALRL